MEQHPVPQNISSYQFRLVGDMTLKQFLELAGGGVISLLIYASGLPGLIKWPLVLFFSISGAALAFLPLHERPLEEWVIAFFRAIYSPTLYRWIPAQKTPVFFQPEAGQGQPAATLEKTTKTAAAPVKIPHGPLARIFTQLENTEKTLLNQLTGLLSVTASFGSDQQTSAQPNVAGQGEVKPIAMPRATPTEVVPSGPKPSETVQDQGTLQSAIPVKKIETQVVEQTLTPQEIEQKAIAAQFSPEAATPIPSEIINTLTGQVMDVNKKIVESVILEIKDAQGRSVRALRSNKAGHFRSVTPVENGTYQIIIEKEGYLFEPITFEAKGEIIAPVAIQAKQGTIHGQN